MDREKIVQWIVRNVSDDMVPADEGNIDALIYNLVQLARYGRPCRLYNYEPEQEAEIEALYREHGVEV